MSCRHAVIFFAQPLEPPSPEAKLARDFGITLFSRAKGTHFLVYHGVENIDFDVKLPPKLEVANLKQKAAAD